MTTPCMPPPDPAILARRREIAAELARLCPRSEVIAEEEALRPYESDGLTAYAQLPLLAILPCTTEEVRRILKYCHDHGIRVVPRGSGTSLSGGALPLADAVLLSMARFDRVLKVDVENRAALVQPGVPNLKISEAAKPFDLYYAPDPSSQIICSIGGNVSENAGGVHCLKYGMTTNNVLSLTMVLMNGEVVRLGNMHGEVAGLGYDLLGVAVGSEGLLGVVTEVLVRLLPAPPAAKALLIGFDSVVAAGRCVAAIIAAGIIPAGMEMMDRLATKAAEDFVHAGYPLDAEAVLIVEVDGTEAEVDELAERVRGIAQKQGATSLRVSESEEERARFWAGRKAAFPAVGRITPDYYCMDGTIPRHKLPEVLQGIHELSEKYGLGVANVFHAGDGNLHPLILYDSNDADQLARAEAFGADILRLCVKVGGVLTGEHGVGVEKRDLMPEMFTETDLDVQVRIKCAFDPAQLLNPGKVFPRLKRCGEVSAAQVQKLEEKFPGVPLF